MKYLILPVFCFLLYSTILHSQQFTEQKSISLTGVAAGSAAWGDYDNDGDPDILLTGYLGSQKGLAKIYKNNGDGTFIEQTSITLQAVYYSSAAWGDYDNDGYLDILLSGSKNNSLDGVAIIYKNNGNGTFSEQPDILLKGAVKGSVAWGDYDNDGDLDILLTGLHDIYSGKFIRIYRNDGNGSFTEMSSLYFYAIENGSAAWGDYNNDGYLDFLLTGSRLAKIYKNNADGTFDEQNDFRLPGVEYSSAAWGDYDNDGFLDILLTGTTDNGKDISKILRNTGSGNFTEQSSIALTGVHLGSAAWADYDNDGNLDIILSGDTRDIGGITKIYRNNGDGTFTEQADIRLAQLSNSSAAWGDYDNDGDLDLLITGIDELLTSKIYKNNSPLHNTIPNAPSGLNTLVAGNKVTFYWNKSTDKETPQDGLNYNIQVVAATNRQRLFSAMADTLTGYRRVVRLGNSQTNRFTSLNLPPGEYYWSVQAIDGAFAGSKFSSEKTFRIEPSVTITAPNGGETWICGTEHKITWSYNNIKDVKIEYSTNNGVRWDTIIDSLPAADKSYMWALPMFEISNQCRLKISDITNPDAFDLSDSIFSIGGQFTLQASVLPSELAGTSAAWGDYDNDGNLDVLITAESDLFGKEISKVLRNNGRGSFSEQKQILIAGVRSGSAAWGDYDNDGYLDILLTGISGDPISKIYRNNGDGTFKEMKSIVLPGVFVGSAAWGDYDNDGLLDILLAGATGSFTELKPISKIFRNEGNGSFTEQTSIHLPGVAFGSAVFGDYDNDGDLDIILTGSGISKIFRNNGDGTFTEQTNIMLAGLWSSSAAWGDYDNDGFLDILLSGLDKMLDRISRLYHNDGNGNFSDKGSIWLSGAFPFSVAWGDYDNDGYLDILSLNKIYHNDGNGKYFELRDILDNMSFGSSVWGDYDNDDDLDIMRAGYVIASGGVAGIHKNFNEIHNTHPNVPAGLKTEIKNNKILFSWNNSTDKETPQNGLNYNLVISNTPNGINILSPMSDRSTGFRRVVRIGNCHTNTYYIQNLSPGKYYWSVQAIDGAFAGSKFSDEAAFVVGSPAKIISPGGGENWTINSVHEIQWTADTSVSSLRIEYSVNSGKNWISIIDSVLSSKGKYSWLIPNVSSDSCFIKLTFFDDNKTSIISQRFSLNAFPGIPVQLSPLNGQKGIPAKVKISWTQPNDSFSYRLQVAEDSSFAKYIVDDSLLTTAFKLVETLKTGIKYFWRVNAMNNLGAGKYSSVWNFTTILPAADSLTLLSLNGNKIKLSWIDRSDNEIGFRIERKSAQDTSFLLIGSTGFNQISYIDSLLKANILYTYRIKAYNQFTESIYSNESSVTIPTEVGKENAKLSQYVLRQNFPNPFNPLSVIKYELPMESYIKLSVYNSLGEKVQELVKSAQCAGIHEINFDASGLSSGVYYYILEARSEDGKKNYKETKKMIVLK